MATSYPGALDDFADPTPTSRQNAPSHAGQHKNVNDAIEAVEGELGTDPSGTESTVKARLEKIEDGTRLGVDSVGSSQIAANAVGSSELADNAVDTAAIQNNAVTSEKIANGTIVSSDVAADTFAAHATVGNLLTANQASGTDTLSNTTGFTAAAHCTISSELWVDRGVYITATGAYPAVQLDGIHAVTPGETITFYTRWISSSSAATRQGYHTAEWMLNGSWVSSQALSPSVGILGEVELFNSVVVPSGVNRVRMHIGIGNAVAGETFGALASGLWKGAGGQWAMPGRPIVGLGRRVTHPNTDDVLVEVWDDGLGRWQVTHYDSGWRNISGALINGWAAASTGLHVRRVGQQVRVRAGYLIGTGATTDAFYTVPIGFQRGSFTSVVRVGNQAARSIVIDGVGVWRSDARESTIYFEFAYDTDNTIPTSLPGALVSAAPYA